jgi:hypothetical protein
VFARAIHVFWTLITHLLTLSVNKREQDEAAAAVLSDKYFVLDASCL